MKGHSFIHNMGARKVRAKLQRVKMLMPGPTRGGNKKPK